MTISRRDFLAVAGLLGVGGMATGCGEWFTDEDAIGGERVIIVGAGAAGMATDRNSRRGEAPRLRAASMVQRERFENAARAVR